jgi:carboxyl-terminal processing protease
MHALTKKISLLTTCSLALAWFIGSVLLAQPLETTKELAEQTRWVVNTIQSKHYLRNTIDEIDGKEMVEAYVDSFDHSRMYFTQEELDDFTFRFANAMENFLAKGNLYAAFEIYEAYKSKAQARSTWVEDRLEKPFDFSIDETFNTDRREAEWPKNPELADTLWERRLKYELLNELLSLASEQGETVDSDTTTTPDSTTDIAAEDSAEDEDEGFDPTEVERLLEDKAFFTDVYDQAKEKILRRYERNLNYTVDREAPDVQEFFINSMTQLFDPHSVFFSADSLESFNSAFQNSFVGIGAVLTDDDGICTIRELLPGGPAEATGLLGPEDQILAVAQGDSEFEDVVDMQLRYIVRKIKGEKNTTVRLLIHPGDAADPSVRKIVPIVRDEVKITSNLASADLITVPSEDGLSESLVGVINTPSFYGNIGAGGSVNTITDDVEELLGKLSAAGAEGIILDLRTNGGGLLTEAVRLAGLFIPVGPVVQVRDASGQVDIDSDRDPKVAWSGPLIVLTSRFSASASEIVAGALKDHGRALIVGESSTHGKGTVQQVFDMNTRPFFSWLSAAPQEPQARPVASKITIKQFYLPDGGSTQVKGVPSDIVLPSVNEFLPIGEDDLPHALPWGQIAAVDWVNDWVKLGIDSPEKPGLIEKLSLASEIRRSTLPEFKFLTEQIGWRHARTEEKKVSLHLEGRIAKKIKDQTYIETLEEEYDALSETNYPSTEFLLKAVEEQEALSKSNLAEISEQNEEADATELTVEVVEEDASAEDEEPVFDIYVRESSRIMADWIQLLETSKQSVAKTVTP